MDFTPDSNAQPDVPEPVGKFANYIFINKIGNEPGQSEGAVQMEPASVQTPPPTTPTCLVSLSIHPGAPFVSIGI